MTDQSSNLTKNPGNSPTEASKPRPIHPDGRIHGAIVGCRRDDGRWLLIRRGLTMPLAPGKVCFPGGTIELGEDPATAAAREFMEELGAKVRIIRKVWEHVFDPPRNLHLHGFLGQLNGHELTPCHYEVHEFMWLTTDEVIEHQDGLPRTGDFVKALVDHH